MITVLLTVLIKLGIILLVLLAVLILLVLVCLLIPLKYSFRGSSDDPEGSEDPFHLNLKEDLSLEGEVRWLLGAIHVRAAAGSASAEGLYSLELSLFGRPLPVEKLFRSKEEVEEEKPPGPKEEKTVEEKIESILVRVERVQRRLEDALYVLGTDYGIRARQVISDRFLGLVEAMLPVDWGITGVVGLGDPARSAKVFSVQGFLYPVTAGHVAVGTEYELYRYDLRGEARGAVRLGSVVYAGIRILVNRDVRRLVSRLRRGPAHSGANGNGNMHRHAA